MSALAQDDTLFADIHANRTLNRIQPALQETSTHTINKIVQKLLDTVFASPTLLCAILHLLEIFDEMWVAASLTQSQQKDQHL